MSESLAPIETQRQELTQAGLDRTRDQLALLEKFVRDVLHQDEDYGVIPGTQKPTLLKPGAANIAAAFNCHAEPFIDVATVDPEKGFVNYEVHVDLIGNLTGLVMTRGYGSCNSHEKKYRYRNTNPVCPKCGKETVFKDKKGPGYYCWVKKGGCGKQLTASEVPPGGTVVNPDPLDQANTLKKMAIKRAEVDAALRLPGVARFFTQDEGGKQSRAKHEDDTTRWRC